MIDRTLNQYRIVEQLGKGGMGEVYLAEDLRLKRRVALKILPQALAADPDRRTRFEREAQAVAALNHPNIVTIYSVEEAAGVHFFTMELVDGQPLSRLIPEGGMERDQLIDLAIPLADALAAAHGQGITHRDLKPENVMVNREGRVKVLDFGLVKFAAEEPDASMDDTLIATSTITQHGKIIGTVNYMSPEQAEGKPVDPRSDVFSLGILLYQMATARLPFKGDTPISTITSILRDDPPSLTDSKQNLPPHLDRVVRRCLAKNPDQRYPSAAELRDDLKGLREVELSPGTPGRSWWLPLGAVLLVLLGVVLFRDRIFPPSATKPESSIAPLDRKMIVVMPFENLGPAEDEYFTAGIAEEITSRLSAADRLGVISRKSAARYAGTDKTIREIGDELGVDFVLEGTVRWARESSGSSRVRITPELIRVSDDNNIWSETYDRVIDDVFEVQSDIAEQVIDKLGITLLKDERAQMQDDPTQNIEARIAYTRGVENLTMFDRNGLQVAAQMFERAAELDPQFAEAWAYLARSYAALNHMADSTADWRSRAEVALARAQALDPDAPAVRLARGYVRYHGFRDYTAALVDFEAVAREEPNNAEAAAAMAFVFRRQGRLDEHVEQLSHALELDPQNQEYLNDLAQTYRGMRRFEKADELYERGIRLAPDNDQFYISKAGILVAWQGDVAAARKTLERSPGRDPMYGFRASLDIFDRDYDAALEKLDLQIQTAPPDAARVAEFQRGGLHILIGHPEKARRSLEIAAEAFEALVQERPDVAAYRRGLSQVYALQGKKDEAIRIGRSAVELSADDAYGGPASRQTLAATYAWVGEHDKALDLLEDLLQLSYDGSITVEELKLDPAWETLADNPRFKALLDPAVSR